MRDTGPRDPVSVTRTVTTTTSTQEFRHLPQLPCCGPGARVEPWGPPGREDAGGRETQSRAVSKRGAGRLTQGHTATVGSPRPPPQGASWLPALPSSSTNRAQNTVLVDQEAC